MLNLDKLLYNNVDTDDIYCCCLKGSSFGQKYQTEHQFEEVDYMSKQHLIIQLQSLEYLRQDLYPKCFEMTVETLFICQWQIMSDKFFLHTG